MPTLDELYSYHAFSKAPVDGQSLAQSVNKAGHTITSKDVWAEKIPHIFKIDKDSDEERNNLPAKVNDLACFVATNKFWIFDGSSWTEITLTNGGNVPTKDGTESTIRYYSDELTALTSENNAGAHSNGFAWRYFNDEGSPSFIAPTDSFDEKGLPALGYNVIIKENGSPITDGIDCYVDYYSGTVFFDKDKRKAAGKAAPSKISLSFFTYIGKKLDAILDEKGNSSDVVSNIDINSFIDSRGGTDINNGGYQTDNDLWGRGVFKTEDGSEKIKIGHDWTSISKILYTSETNPNSDALYVTNNKVFVEDTENQSAKFFYSLEAEALKNGSEGFKEASKLEYFDGNLNNLEIGISMFENASALKTFGAQMPNLIKADNMFKGCSSLATFNCDLTSLKNANLMFKDCTELTKFTANMRTLHSATSMFEGAENLVSFSASLPYLYNGVNMFKDTNLTNINTSFSSLLDGTGMFENTRLSYYAVEKIAKTLPLINQTTNVYTGTLDGDGNIPEADKTDPTKWETVCAWDNDNNYILYNIKLWAPAINDTFYDVEGLSIPRNTVGEITITWKEVKDEEDNFLNYEYVDYLSENQIATIYYELFELMKLKGWTIITNMEDPDPMLPKERGADNRPIPKYARVYAIDKETADTAVNNGKNNIYCYTKSDDEKYYFQLVKTVTLIEPEDKVGLKCKKTWWVKINSNNDEAIINDINKLLSGHLSETVTLIKYTSNNN